MLEFGLTCIPLAEMTEERLSILRMIVDQMTDGDCGNGYDDLGFHTVREWKDAVKEALETLPTVEDTHRPEVNHLTVFEDQPYPVLFAVSWMTDTDDPEPYYNFELLRSAKPVIAKLAEWAKADHKADSATNLCPALPG